MERGGKCGEGVGSIVTAEAGRLRPFVLVLSAKNIKKRDAEKKEMGSEKFKAKMKSIGAEVGRHTLR